MAKIVKRCFLGKDCWYLDETEPLYKHNLTPFYHPPDDKVFHICDKDKGFIYHPYLEKLDRDPKIAGWWRCDFCEIDMSYPGFKRNGQMMCTQCLCWNPKGTTTDHDETVDAWREEINRKFGIDTAFDELEEGHGYDAHCKDSIEKWIIPMFSFYLDLKEGDPWYDELSMLFDIRKDELTPAIKRQRKH